MSPIPVVKEEDRNIIIEKRGEDRVSVGHDTRSEFISPSHITYYDVELGGKSKRHPRCSTKARFRDIFGAWFMFDLQGYVGSASDLKMSFEYAGDLQKESREKSVLIQIGGMELRVVEAKAKDEFSGIDNTSWILSNGSSMFKLVDGEKLLEINLDVNRRDFGAGWDYSSEHEAKVYEHDYICRIEHSEGKDLLEITPSKDNGQRFSFVDEGILYMPFNTNLVFEGYDEKKIDGLRFKVDDRDVIDKDGDCLVLDAESDCRLILEDGQRIDELVFVGHSSYALIGGEYSKVRGLVSVLKEDEKKLEFYPDAFVKSFGSGMGEVSIRLPDVETTINYDFYNEEEFSTVFESLEFKKRDKIIECPAGERIGYDKDGNRYELYEDELRIGFFDPDKEQFSWRLDRPFEPYLDYRDKVYYESKEDVGAVNSKIVKVYPNPARDWVNVEFMVPFHANNMHLILYDELGREAKRLYGVPADTENMTVRFSVHDLPNGAYFATVVLPYYDEDGDWRQDRLEDRFTGAIPVGKIIVKKD